jgi:hypothetical protein
MKQIHTQKEIDLMESTNDPKMKSLLYKELPGIRRCGVNIKITDQEMITLYEYDRNPVSFIHNHGIVYPGGNKCKPILHNNQEKILTEHELKRFYPVALPRQTGLSSSIKFMALHDLVFKGRDVVIITSKMERSAETIKRIMEMYAELPFYMKPGVESMEDVSVRFENGGRITAWPVGRPMGRNVDCLFVDDFQYLDRKSRESIFQTWVPVMSSLISTRIFIGTTGEIPDEFKGLSEFAMFVLDNIRWITIRRQGISTFYED